MYTEFQMVATADRTNIKQKQHIVLTFRLPAWQKEPLVHPIPWLFSQDIQNQPFQPVQEQLSVFIECRSD